MGSYCSAGGMLSIFFKGVYMLPTGTTIRVASRRLEGQTFQLSRTPSRSSPPYISNAGSILCFIRTSALRGVAAPKILSKGLFLVVALVVFKK